MSTDKDHVEKIAEALAGDPKAVAAGFRLAANVLDEFRIRLHITVQDEETHLIERRVQVLVAPKPKWMPEWLWSRLVYWVLDIRNVRIGL